MQIPKGPEDKNCHRCLPKSVPCSKVCHKCNLWQQITWLDQKSKEKVVEWKCMDACEFAGQIEIARSLFEMTKAITSNAAGIESFRNEVVSANMIALNGAFGYLPPPQINHNQIGLGDHPIRQITTVECDQC